MVLGAMFSRPRLRKPKKIRELRPPLGVGRKEESKSCGARPLLFRCLQTVEKWPLATAPLSCRDRSSVIRSHEEWSEIKRIEGMTLYGRALQSRPACPGVE
jgi:hypothetical protein